MSARTKYGSRCIDMVMSDAFKGAKKNRQDKQDNFKRAMRLHRTYPHLKSIPLRFLMWALQRLGFSKVDEAAAMNHNGFTFKKAVIQLNQGESINDLVAI